MRLFKSKRALQISINFIVMLIMAVVIFGFGLYFASTLFAKGGDISEQAFDKFDQQIEDLTCGSASKVCVPVQTKEAIGGDPVIFGIIIENVVETAHFIISVEPSSYVNKLGKREDIGDWSGNFLFKPTAEEPRELKIKYREKRNLGVAIQPEGAQSGTYAFTIKIQYDPSPDYSGGMGSQTISDYDTQKVYVKVPE